VADEPRPFATPEELRAWLEANHDTATELWVLFHKKHTGRPSIRWGQLVDECLCFGWIDGQIKSLDDDTYRQRITPRKPDSTWSKVNVDKMAVLTAAGRVRPAGLAAFERRVPERSGIYAYEQHIPAEWPPGFEQRFQANSDAWAFFQRQIPSYRSTAIAWVARAKQEPTRERRLVQLIDCSARGVAPPPYKLAKLKP
jgi:uncharacterized protein YdeI (YjbR/CyaY-like superfamily)